MGFHCYMICWYFLCEYQLEANIFWGVCYKDTLWVSRFPFKVLLLGATQNVKKKKPFSCQMLYIPVFLTVLEPILVVIQNISFPNTRLNCPKTLLLECCTFPKTALYISVPSLSPNESNLLPAWDMTILSFFLLQFSDSTRKLGSSCWFFTRMVSPSWQGHCLMNSTDKTRSLRLD